MPVNVCAALYRLELWTANTAVGVADLQGVRLRSRRLLARTPAGASVPPPIGTGLLHLAVSCEGRWRSLPRRRLGSTVRTFPLPLVPFLANNPPETQSAPPRGANALIQSGGKSSTHLRHETSSLDGAAPPDAWNERDASGSGVGEERHGPMLRADAAELGDVGAVPPTSLACQTRSQSLPEAGTKPPTCVLALGQLTRLCVAGPPHGPLGC